MAIVEVPGARIKSIGNNRHIRAKPPMSSLPNISRAKSVRTRWQGLVSADPGVGVSIPSHYPNTRDGSKRVSPILVMTA
jgi:hypothetical protein